MKIDGTCRLQGNLDWKVGDPIQTTCRLDYQGPPWSDPILTSEHGRHIAKRRGMLGLCIDAEKKLHVAHVTTRGDLMPNMDVVPLGEPMHTLWVGYSTITWLFQPRKVVGMLSLTPLIRRMRDTPVGWSSLLRMAPRRIPCQLHLHPSHHILWYGLSEEVAQPDGGASQNPSKAENDLNGASGVEGSGP